MFQWKFSHACKKTYMDIARIKMLNIINILKRENLVNDGVLNLILAYGYSFSRAGLIYSLMEYSSTEYVYRVEDELNKHHIKFLKRLLSHIKDSSERENLIKEIGSEIG